MAVAIDSINRFVNTMLESEEKFSQGLKLYEDKQSEIREIFENLKKQSAVMVSCRNSADSNKKVLDFHKNISRDLNRCIEESAEKILESGKGLSFIQKHEKTFVVSVFGKVKSGKSSLGNFIMGTELKKLGIKSEYDKVNPVVTVEDRGKITMSSKLETLSEEDEGFGVGSTETTSTIQYFQIGGLTWLDTPGIGSITKENEDLAKEYIQNSDLVIFTCSSDAAGTQQELSEMKRFAEMKKPVLLLVTMSDTYEEDVDDDGNIIKELYAKSDEDRRDVENYLINCIREQGLEEILKYSDIMTISKQLAVEAVKTGDNEKYCQSNLGLFMDKLIEITVNDAAQMKLATPLKRINTMINTVIGNTGNNNSLINLKNVIMKNIGDINRQEKELEFKRESILAEIRSKSMGKIDALISRYRIMIEQHKKSVGSSEMSGEIINIIAETSKNVCESELSEFMTKTASGLFENISNGGLSLPEMKMQTESISYQQEYVERCRRAPHGLFEHIGDFFGKEYYGTRTRTVTKTNTFDLGINESAVRDAVNQQIRQYFDDNIVPMIEELILTYFRPVRELQQQFVKLIDDTIMKLKALATE